MLDWKEFHLKKKKISCKNKSKHVAAENNHTMRVKTHWILETHGFIKFTLFAIN